MVIGTYQSIAKMADVRNHINNGPLKYVLVAKYLDIYIDTNVNWDEHVNIDPKLSNTRTAYNERRFNVSG